MGAFNGSSDADLLRAFARNKPSRSLQRSFASSPVSASTIRLRRSSLGSLIMAAAFLRIKNIGVSGERSFFLFDCFLHRGHARQPAAFFVFAVNFVGGCARAACGASAGRARLLCFQARPPASRQPGFRGAAHSGVLLHAYAAYVPVIQVCIPDTLCRYVEMLCDLPHGKAFQDLALQLTPWDAFAGRRSARLCFQPAASPGTR